MICSGCNYRNTPENIKKCNYCGEPFDKKYRNILKIYDIKGEPKDVRIDTKHSDTIRRMWKLAYMVESKGQDISKLSIGCDNDDLLWFDLPDNISFNVFDEKGEFIFVNSYRPNAQCDHTRIVLR